MKAAIVMVVATVAGAVGCGGGGDGGPADPVPVEDYAARQAESLCPYYFQCCTDAELNALFSFRPTPPSTVAECQALLPRYSEFAFAALRDAVESGRVEWDAQAAGDCLAERESLGCAYMYDSSSACSRNHRGTVAEGGACTNWFECVSSLACNTTSHTCVAPARLGESCAGIDICEGGTFCRSDSAGGAICVALSADGDPCTTGIECVHGTCTTGRCAAPMPFCDGR